MSGYARGSEWSRWDLHIHTPKSISQDYGGDTPQAWDNFIKKLAGLPPEIKTIAVTDYLFCDGYEYLLTRRSEIPNIELIIPNIEFRLNTFSGTAHNTKRHNFHVLFDPTVSVDVIREQLLNCLSSGYKIQDNAVWLQTPTRNSLTELGQQVKSVAPAGNSVHSKSDLEVGFNNITYKLEDIVKLLEKNPFRGKYVTAIGYSEWDQSRWDQSAAEKRNLINSSHFCLTCLDDPQKISDNRDDLIANKLNSLILHSSDAHNLDRVGKSLLWIKSDPTFAGLKQIINEPVSRVFIGDAPPNYKPAHKVISKIHIPQSSGWFKDGFSLDLNRDLITVIGGRGSGKSALAEAIAYGAGSKDDSEDAFMNKASKHKTNPITGTKVSLEWEDGSKTDFSIGELTENQELVQYLPQKAVEELCSHKNSEKLRKQIENVIFEALDVTDKMGASNFDELRSTVLGDFEYEKEQVISNLKGWNTKYHNLLQVLKGLPDKKTDLTKKKEELKKLTDSMPALPPGEKKGQEELAKLLGIKKTFETKIIGLNSMLTKIGEIEAKIKVFKGKIKEYTDELSILLTSLGITEATEFSVVLNESGMKRILDDKRADITGQIKTLKEGTKNEVAGILSVTPSTLLFDNYQKLTEGIEKKQKETRAFETIKLKYQKQKKTTLELESTIKALESEISKITKESMPEKERLEKGRIDLYASYFELLTNEKSRMEELYKPLQASLRSGTETDKKLVFEAQINYRVLHHVKTGLENIDRTRKGNFRESNSLKNALNGMGDRLFRDGYTKATIEAELKKIMKKFTEFDGETISITDQLRDNKTIEDFDNWLFDPSYFEIISSLKFDGTDLYLLSPGQKGIILLMLYLEIDKTDYRPLIIDQPEENLDNLSVYKDLIGYFRDRKEYRQIIMVTHNPNLVVNTDSEQIVVANYDGARTPRLEYCSGSLENQAEAIPNVQIEDLEDGIIEQVCSILEGGERAFDSRKKKYQISVKSHLQ